VPLPQEAPEGLIRLSGVTYLRPLSQQQSYSVVNRSPLRVNPIVLWVFDEAIFCSVSRPISVCSALGFRDDFDFLADAAADTCGF
jgi:hypothetical protein